MCIVNGTYALQGYPISQKHHAVITLPFLEYSKQTQNATRYTMLFMLVCINSSFYQNTFPAQTEK